MNEPVWEAVRFLFVMWLVAATTMIVTANRWRRLVEEVRCTHD